MKSTRYFETEHLLSDLTGRSLRGGAITLSAQLLKFILQMGATIGLARLLTPADFGLVAMVTAVTGFVALFKDAGLSMATVQRAEISHGQVSNLFWINVVVSLVLALLTATLAPALAAFYGEPRLAPITLALAGTFIFGGLTAQHQALLRRQMQFRQLAVIEILALTAGALTALGLAVVVRSYWALVAMPAVTMAATAAGVWVACAWRPGLPRRGTDVMPMLRFGGNLSGFSALNYLTRNGDNLLIGWWSGATALGFYSKAYSLLLLPINQMNAPISSVVLPALSRLQHDPVAFRALYLKSIQGIAWLGMPAVVVLALHAQAVVTLVLGDQWQPAALVFQLLTPAALMAVTNVATGWALIPHGRADRQLRLALVTSPCFLLAICAGLPFGIEGVAIAVSASRLMLKLPVLAYCFRDTSLTVRDFLIALAGPGTLCGLLTAVHFSILHGLSSLPSRNLLAFALELLLVLTAMLRVMHHHGILTMLRKRLSVPAADEGPESA